MGDLNDVFGVEFGFTQDEKPTLRRIRKFLIETAKSLAEYDQNAKVFFQASSPRGPLRSDGEPQYGVYLQVSLKDCSN